MYTVRTAMISGLPVPIHSHVVCVMPCMCGEILLVIFAMNMHRSSAHLKYDLLLNILSIWYH